jgi:uncharacterized repeat protein (TIGR02543 family)
MNKFHTIRLPFWFQALLASGFIMAMSMLIGGCGGSGNNTDEGSDVTVTYNNAGNPTPLGRYVGGASMTYPAISSLAGQQLGSHVAAYIVRPSISTGNWRVFANDNNTPQLRIVDHVTPATVANVPMTANGNKVVMGPAGDFVYVMHSATGIIDVINSVTYVPDTSINLGNGDPLTDMDFDSNGRLYVLRGGSVVALVDTSTRLITLQQTVSLSNTLAKIAASPDGSMVAVSRPSTNEVLLLDGVALTTVASVSTPAPVSDVVFSNTGTRVYGLTDSNVLAIDPEAVPPAVVLASAPIVSSPKPVLSSLRLSLLGGYLYFLNSSDQSMRILKTADLSQTISVPTGPGAVDIAVRRSYNLPTLPQNANGGGFAEVLVNTNPANIGLEVDVDGASYTNSHSYSAPGATVHVHSTVSQQIIAGTQYTFGSWTPGGTAITQTVVLPGQGSATYTAAFKPSGYLVTVTATKGCTVTTNPALSSGNVVVAAGSTLTITPAAVSSGYTVGAVTWTNSSGSGTIAAPYNYTVTAPTTINVGCNPATMVLLTVATNPAGLQGKIGIGGPYSVAPVSQSVTTNSVQTIAVPTPQFTSTNGTGYSFAGWSNGTTTAISSAQPPVDTTVTANFKASCYTVTTSVLPVNSGAVTISPATGVAGFPANCYAPGTVVTLTAAPGPGYVAQSWTGATGTGSTATVTVNAPVTVTANFVIPPCAGITPPSGMIAWYPLDETHTPSQDSAVSGAGSPANWIGAPSPVPGKVGNALSMGPNSYVEAANSAEGDIGTGDFSVDAWIKAPPSSNPFNAGTIVGKLGFAAGSGAQQGYWFFWGQADATRQVLQVKLGDGSNSDSGCSVDRAFGSCTIYTSSPMVINDNQWHLVAFTVARNSPTGGKMYLDGAVVGTFDPTNRLQSLSNSAKLDIGGGGVTAPGLQGSIDEVEVFNRELGPAELQGIYAAGAAGKCKATLPTGVLTVLTNPSGLQAGIGTGNTYSTAPVSQTVLANQTQTVSVPNPQFDSSVGTGYTFVNWNTGATTATLTVQPTTNTTTTVTANFKVACHVLSVNVYPPGTASLGFTPSAPAVAGFPANCYPPGTTVSLVAKGVIGSFQWTGGLVPNKDGTATATMARPINGALILTPQACLPPPPGMIAWYPFDETKSPSLDYATGGAQLNAPWTDGSVGISTAIPGPQSVPGVVGNALLFREFQFAIANGTAAGKVGTGDFSIDTWVQLSNDGDRRGFLERIGYALFVDDGYLGLRLRDNMSNPFPCSSNPATSQCTEWTSPAMIADNQWHFVAVTIVRNSPTGGKMYVDGSLVYTFDPTIRPMSLDEPSQLIFGGAPGTTKLDEVEIFNRALSVDEVQSIFASGSFGKCRTIQPQAVLTVQTNPAGLQGLIGTSGSYTTVPVSQNIPVNSTQTVSVPAQQFDSTSGIGYVFDNWDFGATTATATVTPNASMTATANYKIACHLLTLNVYPSTAGTIGLTPSAPAVAGFPANCYPPGTTLTLTAKPATGSVLPIWTGATPNTDGTATLTMATPLSAAAIFPAQVCTPPPSGMITWYPLDETQAPYQNYSTTGPKSDAVALFGPTSVPGTVGNALNFGVAQWAEAASAAEGDINTGDLSVDAWVRTSATSSLNQVIADKRDFPATGGIRGYSFYLSGGNLGFQLGNNSTPVFACSANPSATACTDWLSSAKVNDGNWHLVAVTISRGSKTGGKLYVDGTLVLTFDPTGRQGSLSNTGVLQIGGGRFGYDFLGSIDEVEIFNRQLSQAELQAIYAAGSLGKCKPALKPVTLTVQTSPTGLQARIGSGGYVAAPVSQLVTPGQTQSFDVSSPQVDSVNGIGYTFTGWSTGATTTATSVTPTGNLTATANFSVACYILTVNVLPAGAGTVIFRPATGVTGFPAHCYAPGTVVTLVASGGGAAGGTVQSWTNATGTGNTATVTVNGPTTVTANYSATKPVTAVVSSSPVGLIIQVNNVSCTTPCTMSLTPGSSVPVSAATYSPSAGTQYVFQSWAGGGSGSKTITWPSASQLSAVDLASFQTQYQLTLMVAGGGAAGAPGTLAASPTQMKGGWEIAGTQVTVTPTPSANMAFWKWDDTMDSTNLTTSPRVFMMTGPRTITASFESLPSISFTSGKGGYSGCSPLGPCTSYALSGALANLGVLFNNVRITGVTWTTVGGTGAITDQTVTPVVVGNMAGGATSSVTLLATMPGTVNTFTVCTSGTAVSAGSGVTYKWTDGQNCSQVVTK